MGPLPLSTKGHKYILVITDLFSKWVEAFPLAVTDSETLASVLMDQVVCRYGVPRSLHSDQGANLNSQVICALCKRLGINKMRTTAYHPQGNGQVERNFGSHFVQSGSGKSKGLGLSHPKGTVRV